LVGNCQKMAFIENGEVQFLLFWRSTFYDAKEKEKHSLDFTPDDTTRVEVKKSYHRLMTQRRYPS